MKLEIFIPSLPPGINETYGVRSGGRGIYKNKAVKDWQEKAALLIGAQAGIIDWKDHGGEFALHTTISQARHDVDAFVKTVQDTVAEKLGFNDSRIVRRSVEKKDLGTRGVLIILEHL